MKSKRLVFFMMVSILIFTMQAPVHAAWPERPISVAIQHAIGGGTDTTTRAYCKGMEKFLGTTIECFNRPARKVLLPRPMFIPSLPTDIPG
jgi:tripartite-type tricarboxylate transporter receptor subunit TctC